MVNVEKHYTIWRSLDGMEFDEATEELEEWCDIVGGNFSHFQREDYDARKTAGRIYEPEIASCTVDGQSVSVVSGYKGGTVSERTPVGQDDVYRGGPTNEIAGVDINTAGSPHSDFDPEGIVLSPRNADRDHTEEPGTSFDVVRADGSKYLTLATEGGEYGTTVSVR